MLNNISMQGRLTSDVDLRYTDSKKAVCTITIAVERDSTEPKVTDFIDCVAWGSTAEFISKYFGKGSMIIVIGSLHIRNWEDKENNKRRNAEINVSRVYFGGTNNNNKKQEEADFVQEEIDDGELPF